MMGSPTQAVVPDLFIYWDSKFRKPVIYRFIP